MAQTIEKRHGRLDRRTLTLMVDEAGVLDWPGVQQVFHLERHSLHLGTGQASCEVVYGLTGYDPEMVSAEHLLAWARHYWGIENGLHYRRDVTLREVATRFTQPALATVMAISHSFIIGLVTELGCSNLASARHIFDAKIAAQLSQ